MASKDNKVFRGIIKDWQLHHLSVTQEELDKIAVDRGIKERILPLVITGTVASDPSKRFEPGQHMKTSILTCFDERKGYCESQYSTYQLEGPDGRDIFPDLGDGVMRIFY